MIRFTPAVRRRRLSLAFGTSMLALAIGLPTVAYGQCAPDPTVANGTTQCTGADTDGVRVTTPNTQVTVAGGALVSNTSAPAITIDISSADYFNYAAITVNGAVNGGSDSAISLLSGSSPFSGGATSLVLTVADGATVSGATALALAQSAGHADGQVSASIDNAGTLTGSSGVALRGDVVGAPYGYTLSYSRFDSIINRADGVISGSVVGPVGTLTNAGLIDGGTASALTAGAAANASTINSGVWMNSGIIRSNSGAATLSSTTLGSLTNSGVIANTGSGAAIFATQPPFLYPLTVQNQVGGEISSAGATAIVGTGAVYLANRGTITGGVVTGDGASTIDSAQGSINGSVTFGAGNDTLVVRYDGTGTLVTGVSGTIDAGGGINSERLAIATDTTLATPIVLLAGFQQLGIMTVPGATVRLDAGFATPGTIALSGGGALINDSILAFAGQAFVDDPGNGVVSFINNGTITTASGSSQSGALALSYTPTIVNNGTINVVGKGIDAGYNGTILNRGSITATDTAVTAFDNVLANAGTIVSTGGIGVALSGNVGYTGNNSGQIAGATVGAATSIDLTNSGTIIATNASGTAVALEAYGSLINTASGVVGNGGVAVTAKIFNSTVVNAGTINGAVILSNVYSPAGQRYISLTGGVLNGDLTLGAGDLLLTDLVNTGPGTFAGINGTVNAASGALLRYRVAVDAAATLGPVGPFQNAGYDLYDGATLTLTAPTTVTQQVQLAGTGTVNLDGAIATDSVPAILSTSLIYGPGAAYTTGQLAITSAGSISVTRAANTYPGAAVVLGSNDSFTNNGTITVVDQQGYSPTAAISGGAKVINNGVIQLDGGIGVSGGYSADSFINTGTITDTPGSNAVGVSAFTTVQNSGVIRVDGIAVQASYYGGPITNSGTIESRLATGVVLGYGATLTNAASGTIRGVTAVDVSPGGTIVNRGTIVGDVAAYVYSYGNTAYFADGGTVAGNVRFGAGSDLFLETGTTTGVSGTVDGGDGRDVFGHVLTSTGTVSLDAEANVVNFEDVFVQAVGPGTVATVTATNPFAGQLYGSGDGTVVNQATIAGAVKLGWPYLAEVVLTGLPYTLAAFENQGTIGGGVSGTIGSFANSGTIMSSGYDGVNLYNTDGTSFANTGKIETSVSLSGGGTISVTNSGTLAAGNLYGAPALNVALGGYYTPVGTAVIVNSGAISATLPDGSLASGSTGVVLGADLITSATLNNTATGTIRAAGPYGIGVYAYNVALTLDNAGTIGGGLVKPDGTVQGGAIYAFGSVANTIRNSGTLDGAVVLGTGDDLVANSGTITGPVSLGAGNDTFVQQAGATLGGIVDGGDGTDSFVIDSAGSGGLRASQLTNFEQLRQIGTGTVSYTGSFGVGTIAVEGGTLAVAAGQTLATTGTTTVTGGDAAVAITNAGTIAGGIALGSGADTVVNLGSIKGRVTLGAGNDSYVESVGSAAVGGVDGGDGTDVYQVVLAGDRTGIGARSNFEQLAVQGSGTLSLVLDQDFQSVALGGANLTLSLAGHMVGAVTGSDAAETLTVDGAIASVALGGGDDTLALGTTHAADTYDGGTGSNALRFTTTAAVTLAGTATNFSTVSLAGKALTITGTLSSTGAPLAFGAGDQSVSVATGGTLAGVIDLGDGNDSFRLAAGGTLNGTVDGGAGTDTATLELTESRTLAAGMLPGFETLATEGTGQLTLSGTQSFTTVAANTDLAVAAGGALSVAQVQFGAGDHRFTVAGGFAGSVGGGAGNDTLTVSGGSEAAPILFGNISNVETYNQSSGFARIAGTAAFNTIALTGGRLVGQAGSVLAATQVLVGQGATFGSAGTVSGNIAIAGTLSPGASPGTMTVNGNVSLASGSTSLFALSSTVSDKLVVNGNVSIGSDSTLQLVNVGPLRPGTRYMLITATNGITGAFTTVVKPSDLFGFIVQHANEIDLLGEFVDPGNVGPQVSRSIAYANRTLEAQASTSPLFSALPALLTSTGASNAQAFARLTPEPYASATQIGTDDALVLVDAARGAAFAASGEAAHAYSVAATLGQRHRLSDNQATGTAAANNQSYGFLGGIGFGDARWSIGAFGGYLNNRQTIDALVARTKGDSVVAGVQGRLRPTGDFELSASVIYDGSRATTTRAVPVGSTSGRYDLHSLVGDLTARYEIGLAGDWAVTPRLGITYLRTIRDGVAETGGSPFALTVARNRHVAGFGDGAVSFGRRDASSAPFRPFVSLSVRYQIEGAQTDALAGYAGGDLGLEALGAPRARLTGTAASGVAYRLSTGLDVFATVASQTGDDDHQESISAGARLRF